MKNKFFILLGLSIVSFLIYYRLFKVRLPRELPLITNDNFTTISYVYILLIMISLCLANCFKFYAKNTNNDFFLNRKNLVTKTIIYILENPWNPVNIIKEGLLSLDAAIKNNLPYRRNPKSIFIESYGDFIIRKVGIALYSNKVLLYLIIYGLRIIPKLIVCLTFSIDILVFHKFAYSYKFVWLLIIPMCITYLLHSLKTYTTTNLNMLNTLVSFKINLRPYSLNVETLDENDLENFVNGDIYQWYYCFDYNKNMSEYQFLCQCTLNDSYVETNLRDKSVVYRNSLLDQAHTYMVVLFNILMVIKQYEKFQDYWGLLFDISRYFIYTLGWGYLLLYGLGYI